MTRNKITLTWIANDSSRKATLKKRKAGMFKKTKELSVLSDVQSCAIIYNPGEVNPAVFPSYEVVKGMFEKFLGMSMVEKSQKMLTHEGYLTQRVTRETERKNKQKRKNDRLEAQEAMNKLFEGNDLSELDIVTLNNLTLLIVDKLEELEERERVPGHQAAHPLSPPPPPPGMMGMEEANIQAQTNWYSSIPTSMQELMNDQWFMETMALHQDIPGPSGDISDLGMPSAHVAGENEEEDLGDLFPHIYSL